MHNSTNNPEMHQNPNYSHQRDFDVKHHLLKTLSIHALRFYLVMFVKKIWEDWAAEGSFRLKLRLGVPAEPPSLGQLSVAGVWDWILGLDSLNSQVGMGKASLGVFSPSRRLNPHKQKQGLPQRRQPPR